MTQLLSLRAYARHRKAQGLTGTTDGAVRKALATGRITAAADGRVDPEQADRAWAASTAPRVFLTRKGDTLSYSANWSLPAAPCRGSWAPTEAQSKRWRAWRHQLNTILTGMSNDSVWDQVDKPIVPTGSPRLDAFFCAWNDVVNAIVDLDKVLQQYAFAADHDDAEDEEEG